MILAAGGSGFGDDLMAGDLDFAAVKAALSRYAPEAPVTAGMIPFCRLPDLVGAVFAARGLPCRFQEGYSASSSSIRLKMRLNSVGSAK